MPKLVDYPNSSWNGALKLAEAVRFLGNNSSLETAASKLGMASTGGAFNYLKAGAVKFGLLEIANGKASTTDLFCQLDLAYDPAKKSALAAKAFLNPPLFRRLWEKYRGSRLPIDMLEKILAADFNVPTSISGRISSYFIDGARDVGLLKGDNTFITALPATDGEPAQVQTPSSDISEMNAIELVAEVSGKSELSTVTIRGGDMNFSLVIRSKEDVEDVRAMLNRVERKLPTE